jgi:heme-degrading monooxygenase HmoA
MYATVRNYAGNRELADALIENESEVKRLITGIEGFRGYYLIRTEDGVASVSVYDDKSGADESTRVAAEWLRENVPDVAGSPPQVSSGEVIIDL